MAEPTVTLTLPTAVYDELRQRAQHHQRALEDVATATLIGAVGVGDKLPVDLAAAIAALSGLDVDSLWRVSRSQPTEEDRILLDTLVDKRERQGTTPAEDQLLADLIDRHDRVMVLRAEAIALLRQRGIDVSIRTAHA